MKECPKCGYVDPPYWRSPPHYPELDYVRPADLVGLALSWLSIFPTHFDPTPEGIALVNTHLLLLGQGLVFTASLFFAKMFYQQSNLAAYFAEELYPEEVVSINKGLEKE